VLDALYGAGAIVIAAVLAFFAAAIARVWHTPKRLDRLEIAVPVMIRAMLSILRCQKAGTCNGETDASIKEIEDMLSKGAVSQKGSR